MKQHQAYQLRHIFQHHLGPVLQATHMRRLLATMTDMDEDEMAALDEFAGDVGSHVLEQLVKK